MSKSVAKEKERGDKNDPKRTHQHPCMHLRVPLPLPYTPPLFTALEMDLPPVQDLRHFVIGKSWLCFFVVEREPRPAESGQQGEGAEEECVCSHWDNKRRLPLVALRFIICSSSSARDPAPLTGRHRGQSAASRVDRCASQSPTPRCTFSPLALLPSLSSSLCCLSLCSPSRIHSCALGLLSPLSCSHGCRHATEAQFFFHFFKNISSYLCYQQTNK